MMLLFGVLLMLTIHFFSMRDLIRLLAQSLKLLIMQHPADVQNPREFEEQFAVFAGESFSRRICSAEVVARGSADDQIEGTVLPETSLVQLSDVTDLNHGVSMVTATAPNGGGIDLGSDVRVNLEIGEHGIEHYFISHTLAFNAQYG